MNQTDKVMGLADEYAVASQFEHNATKEREALRANIEAMQKDCRTCLNLGVSFGDGVSYGCILENSATPCTAHDKYQPMLKFKQLTRSE